MAARSVPSPPGPDVAEPGAFLDVRATLFAVAYRMLGSATEAEDVLQEAYLRWQDQAEEEIASPPAFLTTVVVRLCIDQLRSARVRRERYVGPWLPEPLATPDTEPSAVAELGDSLSLAFLVLLEELTPAERAVFLLREVFGYDYGELALMVDRSEAACRQLLSRARRQIGDRHHRFDADRQEGDRLADRFVAACADGDLDELLGLLAADVVVWTDGGGKAKAAPKPVMGATRASRFLLHIAQAISPQATVRRLVLNNQPGIVVEEGGAPTIAVVLDVLGGAICGVRVVANPDKLEGLAKQQL